MNFSSKHLSILSFLSLLIIPLGTPSSVNAEITYRCNRVWQSTPCTNGPAAQVIELEAETEEEKEIIRQLSVKRSMLHELRMQAIEAKRDYGVRFSLAEAEYICLQTSSDTSECRKLINESSSLLSEMTLAKAKIQKQNSTKERKTEEDDSSEAEASQNQSVVVINQGRQGYYRGNNSGIQGYGPSIYNPSPLAGYTAGASAIVVPRNGGQRYYGHYSGAFGGRGFGYGFGVRVGARAGGAVRTPR